VHRKVHQLFAASVLKVIGKEILLLSSRSKTVICVGDVLSRHLRPGQCNVPVGVRERRLHMENYKNL